jgi:hypothetical protein
MKNQDMIWDIDVLDEYTESLEGMISNFALEKYENLHDEDNDRIVRALFWGRGDKTYRIVICPKGAIQYLDKKTPVSLITQISNCLIELIWGCYEGALMDNKDETILTEKDK